MIEHMHIRMVAWAKWALTGRRAKGLGYAQVNLAGRSASAVPVGAMLDSDALEIEAAVMALDADLKAAVKAFYLGRGTIEQRASDCRCCVKTLYNRVEMAQRRIMAHIGDRHAAKAARSSANPWSTTLGMGLM